MKFINICGDVIEISNLESIVVDHQKFLVVTRSTKSSSRELLMHKTHPHPSTSDLAKAIMEAESKYTSYIITVNQIYSTACSDLVWDFNIEGFNRKGGKNEK